MELKQINVDVQPEISFFDGVTLTAYQELARRWPEIIKILTTELTSYISEMVFYKDEDSAEFPHIDELSGNFYIQDIAYSRRVNPIGYQIMILTHFTNNNPNGNDDYLGLELTLFTNNPDKPFTVWRMDSSVI